MAHPISWFDIPAVSFERARAFYEQVFALKLLQPDPKQSMAMFPCDFQNGEVGGAITVHPDVRPSGKGVMVFLNAGPDLSAVLARVEPSGGKVVRPKTKIEMTGAGYMAIFLDTEGNSVGLHSPS